LAARPALRFLLVGPPPTARDRLRAADNVVFHEAVPYAKLPALLAKLAPEGHALVAFDINRDPELEPLLTPAARTVIRNLLTGRTLPFDLTVLGNAGTAEEGARDLALVARHRAPGSMTVDTRPTGMAWPRDTYSLAHVALPFRADDPVYGATPPAHWDFMFLGKVQLFGERGVLAVPAGDFARLRHNPFFPYTESRLNEFLTARE